VPRKSAFSTSATNDSGAGLPSLSLPKGGGAIRGIGEKFKTNPVTGTGSMSVPIATSPSRDGFGPDLGLTYDSGTGNGPFGIGWNLALPTITRRTDKGLPTYCDDDESDVFVLSEAEDLVPEYRQNADGSLFRDALGNLVVARETVQGDIVQRYRPRIEGLFARIERWTRQSDGDTHWRSISKDNVLTVYGSTPESRIADPTDPRRVFSWLVSQRYDDKGNAIVYDYVAENDDNVVGSHVNERNRVRSANRYLQRIRYGNRQPLLIDAGPASFRRSHLPAPDFGTTGWMFEVVFDYGEGQYQDLPVTPEGRHLATATLQPPAGAKWPARLDPFSTYRSCFEVRCHRLCQRVLMFHHFPDELGSDDYLVRSTELTYQQKASGSFIAAVVQSGFKRISPIDLRYLKQSLPPIEFSYSASPLENSTHDSLAVREVDPLSLENLPAGIDGASYRWVDLNGEGIAGVFSEQADAWYYKPNKGEGQFGATECVATRPSLANLSNERQELLDLSGSGQLDLVMFGAPMPGFFARTEDSSWDRFCPFIGLPDIDWQDPHLRFVDLTGDGHADILVTNDEVLATWYESKAEEGFGAAERLHLASDEEAGPRLVFADGTQSIYLADMSGDGLSDLVRIRSSEVCYWPNLGYGRFGAKVTLDNAPCFDDAESFDQRRVRLADTDGSGPTDIIYLGRDAVRIYLNQQGNSLSDARQLARIPHTDSLTSVAVVDFLGRGTACLLWSSALPGDAQRSLRYMDLMGGVKPHLLTTVRNNLGVETRIEYASSTQFYLQDKEDGTPWVTRLPFPVHVVTRVETRDLISGNRFVSRSEYHHGYFDGPEREFRGFGRVDRLDTEEFGVLSANGMDAVGTNLAVAFHVPPVLTKTWFHTGAYLPCERISRHFAREYYAEGDPSLPGSELSESQLEAMRLDDSVLPDTLNGDEACEALRALKGAILRQEIYALDHQKTLGRPYSVSERNYTIRLVQPRAANRHGVFFTHARESIEFHYERKLFPILGGTVIAPADANKPGVHWRADPRVSHSMTLDVDAFGNVRKSVSIAYGRRFDDSDPVLATTDRNRQKQLRATLTQATFTNHVNEEDAYRTPLTAETRTYELHALRPNSSQPDITNLFRFDEMLGRIAQAGDGAHELVYEDIDAEGATKTGVYRRLIERVRTRYRSDRLDQLLPPERLDALALPGESYKLAFTPGLISNVYQRPHAGAIEALLPNPAAALLATSSVPSDRGGYVDLDGDHHFWIPSGRVFFHPTDGVSPATELAEATRHFFLPRRVRDPFGHGSVVEYSHDLFPAKTRDSLGNTTEALHDYRVLQPKQLADPNGNRSFAAFDALGLVVATAVRGKMSETLGDSLDDFDDLDANPSLAQLQNFLARPAVHKAALLKGATSRFVYDVHRFRRCGAAPFAASLMRETHNSDPLPAEGLQIQVSFGYSDGFGRELESKVQAEPGLAPLRAPFAVLPSGDVEPGALTLNAGAPVLDVVSPRWVGKGRTVYNNKGKPVKQYEPFFSSTHLFEAEPELTDTGVTSIRFYDPVERVVATLHPNHTYEKIVFDPWKQATWDVNDTVLQADPRSDPDVGEFFQLLPTNDYLPSWHDQRKNEQKGNDENLAASRTAAHAATPTVAYFDTLGRPAVTVVDNGKDPDGAPQKFSTRLTLDIEGNQRSVQDANGRVVMSYAYDMLGNRIQQASMEAGQRWMLNDVAGKPIRGWNSRGHTFRTEYDELRRPVHSFVLGADPQNPAREICFEQTLYGESPRTGLNASQVLLANLRGKVYRQFDTAGVFTSEAHDFKGNPLRGTRRLLTDYKQTPDWSRPLQPALDPETYTSSTRYDALNRPIQVVAPHSTKPGTKPNVIRPGYNQANLLQRVDVWLGQAAEPSPLLAPATADLHAVANIDYDAKGQRTRITYGNGTLTEYTYDEQTFRLVHMKTRRASAPAQAALAFQDLFYTYDPVGNITHIRDDAQPAQFFDNQVVLPQNDYVYDASYRLISATGREHIGQVSQPETNWNDEFRTNLPHPSDGSAMRNYTERYVYDAVGNFEKVHHDAGSGSWRRTYVYDEPSLLDPTQKSNRLSRTNIGRTAAGGPTEHYAHDAHGNITSMPHLTRMDWNFNDQLSATSRQAVNPSPPPRVVPETTFYVYDATGERVRKVTERQNGTRKSERIYLGGFEVFREFSADGQDIELERETLHVMDDKQRIALVEARTAGNDGAPTELVRYQFGNHLSSASLELDARAKVISYEEYTPYGSTSYQAVDKHVKAAAKRYRYTGKERDEETGLEYHSTRYYVPWLGIWSACDSAGLVDGSDLYVYVRNNPIAKTDSAGTHGNNPAPNNEWVNNEILRLAAEARQGPTLALVDGKFVPFYRTQETIITAYEGSGGAISNADAKRQAEGQGHIEFGDLLAFAKGLVNGPASWINEKAFEVDPNHAGAAAMSGELGKNLLIEATTFGFVKLLDLAKPAELASDFVPPPSPAGGAGDGPRVGEIFEDSPYRHVQQHKANWCGAACGEMSAERLGAQVDQAKLASSRYFEEATSYQGTKVTEGGFHTMDLQEALTEMAPVKGREWRGGDISIFHDISTPSALRKHLIGYLDSTQASIMLRVDKGKHWIIIDSVLEDGRIAIRDPRNAVSTLVTAEDLSKMKPTGDAVFSLKTGRR